MGTKMGEKRKTPKTRIKKKLPKDKELNDLWKARVRERAGFKCEVCGKSDGQLHCHHFKTKGSSKRLQWVAENGFCLCMSHHTGWNQSEEKERFSAHTTVDKFKAWAIKKRGQEWYDRLLEIKNSKGKIDKDKVKEELMK